MNKKQSKKVTHIIFGLGVSGISCARYFDRIKQVYYIVDTRINPPESNQLAELSFCQGHSFGQLPFELLEESEVLVVSPGISLDSPYIKQAKKHLVDIVGDVEIFARCCKKKIVAITGSNGKSTVTELTEKLLRAAGMNVQKGGNVGLPVLDFLPDDPADIYVLELSSFQLDTTRSLSVEIAVLLNISEDHMDRYASFEDYCYSKRTIFDGAHCKIFNWDDRLTVPTEIAANDLSFSFKQPKEVNHVASYLAQTGEDFNFKINDRSFANTRNLQITGTHNWLNALVSLSILERLGISLDERVLTALESYPGLAHRFQLVSKKLDCLWINDSKATNVGATIAALNSLKHFSKSRVFLIAGGDSKKADLTDLKSALENNVYRLIVMGQDAERLVQVSQSTLKTKVKSLSQAVKTIKSELKKGDIVLLSPACASLDMFTNFEARGDAFITAIEECA